MGEKQEIGAIETEVRRDVTVVRLAGDWDISNAAVLRQHLQDAVGSGRALVVSLMRTGFLDSCTVSALFCVNKQMRLRGRQLVLHLNTASIVRRALEVSGLTAALACTTSLDDAVAIAARSQEGF